MKETKPKEELRRLKELYGCPDDINFRFWLFALATGAEVWENNIDYMLWIQGEKYGEAADKAGVALERNEYGWSTADQIDRYMASGIPIPTSEQIAKAHHYFETMPSRSPDGRS